MRPNSLVALVGPHSPLAQSGNGTITVCNSSHAILNLHTLLNFIGSPVKYSLGVTALAKISRRKAPEQGACTRNATIFPTTDYEHKFPNKILICNILTVKVLRKIVQLILKLVSSIHNTVQT